MDILSGSQPGNFGWLSWTGVPSSPALATSLTPPGNSVAYINQSDPADSVVSVGDWVSGFPSVTNSSAVNQALDNLIGEIITIPIWEESAEQGNNSVYTVVRFADVELTGYHLPSENRISAIFHGFVHCEAPVANDDFYETNDSLHVATPGILGNDTDLEGDSLTAVLVSNPAQGFLALNNNGSFDYLPNDGFEGTDSFTYLATDGALDSNVATVVITVDPAVPALISVPDVVGMLRGDAETAIAAASLTVGAVTTAHSTTVTAGAVISQNPAGGTQVAPGTAVDVVISLGLAPVTVPDVVGLPQGDSETAITDAGLTVGAVTAAYSATLSAGIVKSPVAGLSVAAGSAVDLVASLGLAPVTVPNVVGLVQGVAEATIVATDLGVGAVTTANSETVPAGAVISQSPVGGTLVGLGSTVDLVVSVGLATAIVPDVIGLAQGDAETTVTGASLTVVAVTTAYSDTVAAGVVIGQSPAAGAVVALGSAVDLVVSLGLAPVTVPNVVGMTQSNADSAIVAAGLAVGHVGNTYSNIVPVGVVIGQSPVAGTLVALGSAVDLVVSLGPEPVVPTAPTTLESDCSGASSDIATLWPPNHKYVTIKVSGITGEDGSSATITIDSIYQDEAVSAQGSGNTGPDARGVGTDTAEVRAERSGPGDGRVYHIMYTAEFGDAESCSGTLLVGIPHDRGKKGRVPVDGGALFDSTSP